MASDPPILIAGAGPTGLVLALCLQRAGVPFRLIDEDEGRVETSRAIGVQARTLEFYDMLGLGRAAVEEGLIAQRIELFSAGRPLASTRVFDKGVDTSPHPYLLLLAQDVHERLLEAALAEHGTRVERSTRLTGVTQDADGVTATLATPSGERMVRARWLVGCDGARSLVRQAAGIGFAGGTNTGIFYVADARTTGAGSDMVRLTLDLGSPCLMLPVRSTGMHRLIGLLPEGSTVAAGQPLEAFAPLRPRIETALGITIGEVTWFSSYRVHHRVADRFRNGRLFLAGDAAHVHSPVGGQGMNTGIGDAVNLGWKLAGVVQGRLPDAVLDTYESERIAFARLLIATTDRFFGLTIDQGLVGRLFRTVAAPTAFPLFARLAAVQRFAFRRISQTAIAYPRSPLSEGRAGTVVAGERVPWIRQADGSTNFDGLDLAHWQVQVFGTPAPALVEAATRHGLPLRVFHHDAAAAAGGVADGAAYLLRPDGHVALAAEAAGAAEALDAYAGRWFRTG